MFDQVLEEEDEIIDMTNVGVDQVFRPLTVVEVEDEDEIIDFTGIRNS